METGKRGTVFYTSVTIVSLFVLWGFFLPKNLEQVSNAALAFTTRNFGWFYVLATFIFLVFALYLAFGPYGKIKLGEDDDEPDYSFWSWLAMLFSAGMGIGLVFWGVAEPIFHYITPPSADVEPGSIQAASTALRYSFFHWGLHPWAIYTIVGLSIAYFQFRKKETGIISSTFRPLIGDRVDGSLGKAIDTLASIATAFGVATSLGLGALQISGGMNHLFNIPNERLTQLIIIIIVTLIYMISATTGLNKGILYLSNTNLFVAAALLLVVFLFGPTQFMIEAFTTTIGSYLGNLIPMSFRMTPFTNGEWIGAWTLFYWAWWIAWAPFVGAFIARVSRGRSIKEFVMAVLFVPTLLGCLWFAVFGGTALNFEINGVFPIADAVQADETTALFVTLEQLPLGWIIGVIAVILIVTFFITSADSATFVLGMLTSNGSLNPANSTKLIWGVLQSSVAAALLLSGGLNGLQTASIVAALPFSVIMIFMVFSINKALRAEIIEERRRERRRIKKLEQLVEEEILNRNE